MMLFLFRKQQIVNGLQPSFWPSLAGSTRSPGQPGSLTTSHRFFAFKPGSVLAPGQPGPGLTLQVRSSFKTMVLPSFDLFFRSFLFVDFFFQFHHSTFTLLEIRLCYFSHLFSIGLSHPYYPSCRFVMLTWIYSG
jgi:hypothetical protein